MERSALNYRMYNFSELTIDKLYRILQLRQEVFVVEQTCPYLDIDGKDQDCQHIIGTEGGEILAYARIAPLGVSYPDYTSIGRVITAASVRGTGEGHRLMKYAVDATLQLYPRQQIKISAQNYILDFYQEHGFVPTGVSYLEDDIPHTAMVYNR